jgi:hypothetical protein
MLGIEQQGQADVAVLGHRHIAHVSDLAEIGGGADRPLVAILNDEAHFGPVRQDRTAPTPRPEGADRRQRKNTPAPSGRIGPCADRL